MQSENPTPVAVKKTESESEKKIRQRTGKICAHEIRDRRTFTNFLRIQGYLHGVFVRKGHGRTLFYDFDCERFHRKTKTKGKTPIAVRTLERVLPQFARWSDEYRMDRVNQRGRWVRRFTPKDGVQLAVPGATIRDRLRAAVLAYVAKGGRCKVDRAFCRRFAELSALPLAAVETIWLRLPKFDGLRCRWRGEGANRKFVVEDGPRWAEVCAERAAKLAALRGVNLQSTDPQTSPPVSISFGNERFITSGQARGPEETARAAPARTIDRARDETDRLPPTNAEPGSWEHPGEREKSAGPSAAFAPLHICGRFVSARKLQKLAAWLAGTKLKFAHVGRERVAWLFPHARNFAYRALRAGYAIPQIAAAYAAGVEHSHEDALDRDRLPGGGYASVRPPSAAVVYGWVALKAADARTVEARWSEFFNTPRAPRDVSKESQRGAASPSRSSPSSHPSHVPRLSAAEAAARLAELRAVIARPDETAPAVPLGELAEFLRVNGGMTLAQFRAQPKPWRGWIVGEAKKWLARKKYHDDKPREP